MKEFDFSDPRAFILPSGMGPYLSSFGAYRSRGEQVVMRHLGIDKLDMGPGNRYSLAKFVAAMRELQDQFGPSFMRKMGTLILSTAVFPPELDSVEKLLASVGQAYLMNHDSGGVDIGHYRWVATGPRRGTMTCDNPYACATDMGLMESILARFALTGGSVSHAEGPCRHHGGDACSYHVEW